MEEIAEKDFHLKAAKHPPFLTTTCAANSKTKGFQCRIAKPRTTSASPGEADEALKSNNNTRLKMS